MLRREKNFESVRVALWLTTFLALTTVQPASATVFPGPDEFGYSAREIPSNLRDISASGTFVPLGDDQVSAGIPIPFPFRFYGVPVTQVFISSNGFITFSPGQSSGCCSGDPIPDTNSPNNIIAGFWEDLNNPQGNIRFETMGSPGNREFVVGFYNVPHYSNGPQVTFEIILHEAGSAIELQYGLAPSDADGDPTTVGIENADGTIGLQIVNSEVSFNTQGFLITLGTFQEFKVNRAHVSFGRGSKLDKYDVKGRFMLSEFSNGIDPPSENVVVSVGTSSLTIPAGSFKTKGSRAEFKGGVDGVFVQVRIQAIGGRAFSYRLRARGVDLSNSTIPMDISLKIGADSGMTAVPLSGELEFRGKDGHDDHDDDD